MRSAVCDASVAYKWTVPGSTEAGADAALSLLQEHLEGTRRIHVPALLFYEVGNILVCGASRSAAATIADELARLARLALQVSASTPRLTRRTAELARELTLTFYDASYLALAEVMGCELVTADRRLHRKAAPSFRLRLLGG